MVPAFLGGQVGADISVLQVHIQHFVALAAQDFNGLSADTAGTAGYDINSHNINLLGDVFLMTLSYKNLAGNNSDKITQKLSKTN
jgi:hypothetical protein